MVAGSTATTWARSCRGCRDTSEQATTADGDHDDRDVWVVVEELFGDRSRAGGDLDLVVGVTEQGALVAGEADGRLVGVGVLGADAMHLGAVVGDPLHLHRRCGGRHEHCRRDIELSVGVGVGEAGVPAGGDDDADRRVQLDRVPARPAVG